MIAAVNRARRVVLCEDGSTCPISTFFDADGDDAAVVGIGQLPDGRWFTVDLREFHDVRTH